MTRPILIAMAAVAALAAAPSLAASGLTWEQEARKYAPYAFGNPVALVTGSIQIGADYIPYVNGIGDPSGLTSPQGIVDDMETGSIERFGDYLPYVNGAGDPSGLTSSNPVDAVVTGSVEVGADYIPYVNGIGDPSGLTSPHDIVDDMETGSIERFGDYLPYVNGVGDPSGLSSPQYADDTQTGSIGSAEPRVDVEAFCEGEGKLLAERHYVGFCHLAD
jgi:hypothetical protein